MAMELPYPESLAAFVALVENYERWRLAEANFDKSPSTLWAACADSSWFTLIHHARNCGMPLTVPSVKGWIEQKVVSFVESIQ